MAVNKGSKLVVQWANDFKLGPNLWNLFIDDLLYYLPDDSLVNFAGDNTLYAMDDSLQGLRAKLNSLVGGASTWYRENGMQPNPMKFQAIFFGDTPRCAIQADSAIIQIYDSIRLLGVILDSMRKYNTHVSDLCKKAGRHISIIKRVSRFLPTKVKLLLYKTYVACHFSYCPLVWHFCGASATKMVDNMQYRALKFIFNDYNSEYSELLKLANLPSLELRRQRALCIEVFKAIHKMSPLYISNLFPLQNSVHKHNTKSVNLVVQCHYESVSYGTNSFKNQATHLWNNLPNALRAVGDLDTFRLLINNWQGMQCKCNLCKSFV